MEIAYRYVEIVEHIMYTDDFPSHALQENTRYPPSELLDAALRSLQAPPATCLPLLLFNACPLIDFQVEAIRGDPQLIHAKGYGTEADFETASNGCDILEFQLPLTSALTNRIKVLKKLITGQQERRRKLFTPT